MKWPKLQNRKQALSDLLRDHHDNKRPLPGVAHADARDTLAMQIVASIRREEYFDAIQNRGPIGSDRADPHSDKFEAELGVVHLLQNGSHEEAAWLAFLMVYLAKPADSRWRRLRDIYGMLGVGRWDWALVSRDPNAFEKWLAANWQSVGGKFGNHRKYESLQPGKARSMGPAIVTYVNWVNGAGGHRSLFAQMVREAGNDPHVIFDAFYRSLPVGGFGRLGRFDWVSMLSRYGFIPAKAGSAYLNSATGPKAGARLLFANDRNANVSGKTLQEWLTELDEDLGVGMEVLEDAICNWQKRPAEFEHFLG